MADEIYGTNLAWNLYEMRNQQEFCDLVIDVNSVHFYCHTVVVAAASPILKNILAKESNTRKLKRGIISVSMDFISPEVAELLLKFFYIGEIPDVDVKQMQEFWNVKRCLCDPEYTVSTMDELQNLLQTDVANADDYEVDENKVQPGPKTVVEIENTSDIEEMMKDIKKQCKEENGKKKTRRSTRNKYHLPKNPPFTCPCESCGKIFETRERLRSHYRHNHSEKKFKCNSCPLRFLYPKDLTSHMRTHTGEKPFVCETCGKGFAQMGSMYIHSKVHLKKEFIGSNNPCGDCIKTYVQKEKTMKVSELIASQLVNTENIVCPNENCAKKFATLQTLRKHIDKNICNNNASFCAACKIKFDSQQQLKKHIGDIHCTHKKPIKTVKIELLKLEEGLGKKFPCLLCEIKFETRLDLDEHNLTHESIIACETINLDNTNNSADSMDEFANNSNLLELCSEVVMDEDME